MFLGTAEPVRGVSILISQPTHVDRVLNPSYRCPMECTLSSSTASWSCQVSLRFEYNNNGARISATRQAFSPVLTDRGQVELWIRRGQAAILSPHRSPSDFEGLSRSQLQQLQHDDHDMLKFSKNIVCIDIKDPNATDLSFIDLPGMPAYPLPATTS